MNSCHAASRVDDIWLGLFRLSAGGRGSRSVGRFRESRPFLPPLASFPSSTGPTGRKEGWENGPTARSLSRLHSPAVLLARSPSPSPPPLIRSIPSFREYLNSALVATPGGKREGGRGGGGLVEGLERGALTAARSSPSPAEWDQRLRDASLPIHSRSLPRPARKEERRAGGARQGV